MKTRLLRFQRWLPCPPVAETGAIGEDPVVTTSSTMLKAGPGGGAPAAAPPGRPAPRDAAGGENRTVGLGS
jgi:hypothetical protein